MTGAGMVALVWLINKIRGKPSRPSETVEAEYFPPTREEMIERLRAMVDDPDISSQDRERARVRLEAFDNR